MSTTKQNYVLSTSVQDSQGDIVIVCPNDDGSGPETVFKLRKRNLESHSSVFSEMLASAEPGETWGGLPLVKLVEPSSVMATVFAIICNVAENSEAEKTLGDWDGARAVWEAAHKYNMQATRLLAGARLLLLVPKMDTVRVIALQVRARTLQDLQVAQKTLDGLKVKDLSCMHRRLDSKCNCRIRVQRMSDEDRAIVLASKLVEGVDVLSKLAAEARDADLAGAGATSAKLDLHASEIDRLRRVVKLYN